MRKRKKQLAPLVIESYPPEYKGYPFITLIQYRQDHILTIIDNSDDREIRAFVLDWCQSAKVNEEMLITIANEWYENKKDKYPISFEFSKRNMSEEMVPIYMTFNIDYVSRVIGPLYKFNMGGENKIKRKRKRSLPSGIQIIKKKRI